MGGRIVKKTLCWKTDCEGDALKRGWIVPGRFVGGQIVKGTLCRRQIVKGTLCGGPDLLCIQGILKGVYLTPVLPHGVPSPVSS